MTDNVYIRQAKKQFSLSILETVLEPIRETARGCGYAISVHGSLSKDIDLIATPWIYTAKSGDVLVQNIVKVLSEYLGNVCVSGDVGHKAHGRKAYTIVFNQGAVYFDLSVMGLCGDCDE